METLSACLTRCEGNHPVIHVMAKKSLLKWNDYSIHWYIYASLLMNAVYFIFRILYFDICCMLSHSYQAYPFVIKVFQFHLPELQWRHNERDGVSNHRRVDGLLNRSFRRRAKKTSKLLVTGLCEENSLVTGELPSQRASNAGNVFIWWRHHVKACFVTPDLGQIKTFHFISNVVYWGCVLIKHNTMTLSLISYFQINFVAVFTIGAGFDNTN